MVIMPTQEMFQSTPGLLAGRYAGGDRQFQGAEVFQSTPGLLAGRYVTVRVGYRLPLIVSIHARLISRAIRWKPSMRRSASGAFQSTPGLLAGRYARHPRQRGAAVMFQSTPGLLAGRY